MPVDELCDAKAGIIEMFNNEFTVEKFAKNYINIISEIAARIVCFHVICTDCYINLFDICIKMLGIYFSKKYSPEYI